MFFVTWKLGEGIKLISYKLSENVSHILPGINVIYGPPSDPIKSDISNLLCAAGKHFSSKKNRDRKHTLPRVIIQLKINPLKTAVGQI